jgi:hypothetical protein
VSVPKAQARDASYPRAMSTQAFRISDLIGEQFTVVAFVMDYVEFHFNGPVLRSLTDPIVQTETGRVQFPEPGSRDALCTLIGSTVEVASVHEGDRIEIRTAESQTLIVPLDEASRRGPEAAHFVPLDETGRSDVPDMHIW